MSDRDDRGRDVSRLHGDELTWALHQSNETKYAVLNAKMNLVLGLLMAGLALFGATLFMKG